MAVILLDIDGVCANFSELMIRCVEQVTGSVHTEDEITQWDTLTAFGITERAQRDVANDIVCSEGACRNMLAYEGAAEGVRRLTWRGHTIVPCTSPFPKSRFWHYERLEWIEEHLGPEVAARTIFANEKFRIHGDYLIDDKVENLVDWEKENPIGRSIQFIRPWNCGDVAGRAITCDWQDLVILIDELESTYL